VNDRRKEWNRRRGLHTLTERDGRLSVDIEPPPVLNVSPTPPSPKRGGAQIQMLDRLAEERNLRTVALAYPRDGGWWMEVWTGSCSGITALGAATNPAELIAHAARLVGSGIIHIESLSGLPLSLVPDLEELNLPTVLSVHDFSLFCRKPHLIERTTGTFCDYSRDMARCNSCLRDIDPEQRHSQTEYQRNGVAAFESATAVIYPSDFLRRQHETLFPGCREARRDAVIAPATSRPAPPDLQSRRRPRIAFVGGPHLHKGGALIAPTMGQILNHDPKAVGFIYGSGDGRLARQLRRTKGIRVRGYYRQGHLPSLLLHDRIAVAVLPSIWPEAYGLVVDECLSVGVPVIAFDHGAVGDRLRSWQAGRLVLLRSGQDGLAAAVSEAVESRLAVPGSTLSLIPTPATSAREHLGLYQSLVTR
jgi:glycosyltransferase involved in cell wall biosynthesis